MFGTKACPLPQKTVALKAKVSAFWIGSQRTASKPEEEFQQERKTQKVNTYVKSVSMKCHTSPPP